MLNLMDLRIAIANAITLDDLVRVEEQAKAQRYPSGVLHALLSRRLDEMAARDRVRAKL